MVKKYTGKKSSDYTPSIDLRLEKGYRYARDIMETQFWGEEIREKSFKKLKKDIKKPEPIDVSNLIGVLLGFADDEMDKASKILYTGKRVITHPKLGEGKIIDSVYFPNKVPFNYQKSASALYNAAIDAAKNGGRNDIAEQIYNRAKKRFEVIRPKVQPKNKYESNKRLKNLESAIKSLHNPKKRKGFTPAILLGISLLFTATASIKMTGAVVGFRNAPILEAFAIVFGLMSLFFILRS